jgi:Ca2+-binding RTX toxin-like protein
METEVGSPQADTITRDSGANTLSGLAGGTPISGGEGNDVLSGGAGADTISGGNGTDTATYLSDPSGITADMGTGVITDGYGATDGLTSIESVIGSNTGADSITGSPSNDHIWGFGGNDSLSGLAGNDYLNGGARTDTLDGGAGIHDTCLNGETVTNCEPNSAPALSPTFSSEVARAKALARVERRIAKLE